MKVQKQDSVQDQSGNISKPLLGDVILSENDKWKNICEIEVQHALFEHIHVEDTIALLKTKYSLLDV